MILRGIVIHSFNSTTLSVLPRETVPSELEGLKSLRHSFTKEI